jgi:hypothetical protein
VQCLACLALLTWYEVTGNTTDSALGTVVAVGKGMGQLVIVVAAWTVTLLEGYSGAGGAVRRAQMLAERYLRRRYREGRAEGRAERDAEWVAWLRRFREAEARGEPFDEPSPAGDEARNGPRNHN